MYISIGFAIFVSTILILSIIGFVGLLLIDKKFNNLLYFLKSSKKLSIECDNLNKVINSSVGELSNDLIMLDKGYLTIINEMNNIINIISLENKSYQKFLLENKKEKENQKTIDNLKQKEIEEQQLKEEQVIINEMYLNQYESNCLKREPGVYYDVSQTSGDYDGFKCPICDNETLSNMLGQRWCPDEKCRFGLNPDFYEKSFEIAEKNKNSKDEKFSQEHPFIEKNSKVDLSQIIVTKNNNCENTIDRRD